MRKQKRTKYSCKVVLYRDGKRVWWEADDVSFPSSAEDPENWKESQENIDDWFSEYVRQVVKGIIKEVTKSEKESED